MHESQIKTCKLKKKLKLQEGWEVQGGTLTIAKLQQKHRGSYRCKGVNSVGNIGHITTVYIEGNYTIQVRHKHKQACIQG